MSKQDFTKCEIVKSSEGLALGHSGGSYGWRIREELAHARPLSVFLKVRELGVDSYTITRHVKS
jgi:hypothetical protein